METIVQETGSLQGILRVPGDKSISHRALILGSIAKGKTTIEGLPDSADIMSTINALRSLGCFIEETADSTVLVLPHPFASGVTLHAGNSGTTARLISGLVAGCGLECVIDGDESLRRRPMARVADPLSAMGADIRTSSEGTLPMSIKGGELKGITHSLPVPSAQVKSAVLIAGLFAEGETTVCEPLPTRDHTERLLGFMGAEVEKNQNSIKIKGQTRLCGSWIKIPGDISSAAFFIVAGTCISGSEITIPCTGINPARTGLLEILGEMGASIEVLFADSYNEEPIADLIVRSSTLRGVEVRPDITPLIIDELPVLALAATQAEGETIVTGAGELRYKESDRINATVENLRILGANIEELEDGFIVKGPTRLRGARVASYGDHRIAMTMAIAGLLAKGKTCIEGSEAVSVSYPGFFRDLRMLTLRAISEHP